MKIAKLTLCLATLAVGVASAASNYTITLTSDTMVGNTHLKAGEYKLTVEGDRAIFKQGKTTTPVPVTVEKNATAFPNTALDTSNSKLNSIELGGTNTRLVISSARVTTASAPADR